MNSEKKFSYRVLKHMSSSEHCVSEEHLDGFDRSEELWACSRVRGANDGPVAMRDEIN